MNPILPPKGKPTLVPRTAYFPEKLWEELTEIAEETKGEDPDGKGYSRNEVLMHFAEWACRQYRAERAAAKKLKK